MYNIGTIIMFAMLGTLGGFINVLITANSVADIKTFDGFKTILIGLVVGILYMFLYYDHNFPNSVMTFVVGYTGADFIEGLIEKCRKKETKGE